MITDLFIKRPVLSSAISIFLFLSGILGYYHLSVRMYPKVTSPVITINTGYPGASSQVVQSYVTSVIEESLSGIEGVDYM